MASVRLKSRHTGSVVVVPEEKAASLAILGFDAESDSKPARKTTAKKASSSSKSK